MEKAGGPGGRPTVVRPTVVHEVWCQERRPGPTPGRSVGPEGPANEARSQALAAVHDGLVGLEG